MKITYMEVIIAMSVIVHVFVNTVESRFFFNYLWKSKLVRIIERFEKSGVKLQC